MINGETLDLSKLVINPHDLPLTYEVSGDYGGSVSVDSDGKVTANYGPFAMVNVYTSGSIEYASGWQTIAITLGTEEDIKKMRCDANGDGSVTITDAVTVVNYILNEP